jgi:hypothetical protein
LDYGNPDERKLHVEGMKDKNEISEASLRIDNVYKISEKNVFEFGLFNIHNQIDYFNVFKEELNFNML